MNVSKKAEYAIKAVISIARYSQNKPLQIGEISKSESIPVKFLEQILLILKNNGLLNSKRGANGGYLLAMSSNDISIGMIIEIIDGPFHPLGSETENNLSEGLKKCFNDLIEMYNNHLNKFTIQDVLENEKNINSMSFEI